MILGFCFTIVLDHYFASFLLFPWPINYNHTSRGTKSSTHSSPSWFWSKIFSFPWIHGVVHDYVLWASNHTNEWKTAPRIIPRFDIDLAPSWWIPNHNRCTFVPKLNPLLILFNFFKLSYFGDFVASQPRFWWWT